MNHAEDAQVTLVARLNTSHMDSRRGVVRVHAEVLSALGLREWDAIGLYGTRSTAAVVARSPEGTAPRVALLDDVTLSNAGIREDATVIVRPIAVQGARRIVLSGSALTTTSLDPGTLRQALLGKVLAVGDTVSLLPRDLGPGTSTSTATQALRLSVGITWTSELLTVVSTDPGGAVSVQPNSALSWDKTTSRQQPGARPSSTFESSNAAARQSSGTGAGTITVHQREQHDTGTRSNWQPETPKHDEGISVGDLVGMAEQVTMLTDWLSLALDEPELLASLGASPRLGVLVTGPAGVGKATFARAVCAKRALVELDGPGTGALEAGSRAETVSQAIESARGGGVLLITEIDALLPSDPEPVSSLILSRLRRAISDEGVVLIATTAHPDGVDRRIRGQDLCDREITVALPGSSTRRALLDHLLRDVPTAELDLEAVSLRTPGFVAADLMALRREGALRAASRASKDGTEGVIEQRDLLGALEVIRPLSRSGTEELSIGSLTLDDVGDMVETKQALTETVLWPLRHPDTFKRLGVDPPRGVLLYGPPGCGKTFVVRALASSGQLSVHSVKGSELMDKWVGASEKAVRDLFQRARNTAPSLIFLDEIDALVPRRGQSTDSGVGDKVVAALLTELDGTEPLRDVVVLGATNRPELIDPAVLRPGRLERLVFVPPPDSDARAAILRAAGGSIPLADDVNLDELAENLDGYSAADCAALLREAALAAMRRSMDATDVTADDVATARKAVRPSLDPDQVASIKAFADRRSAE
ncbi:transitional endoplasmic reticulum ATPase [Hoyosella altamirensis]|uniref:Transitional endoplasmic reticulum ATPase n=2 Tax=Hoyosella altamirensis TaxID=616997 RepID=A0A839RMB8_9ACTN|nr:transitional endoplasmic reticulum ATPase [Hoyosella altamirensis]